MPTTLSVTVAVMPLAKLLVSTVRLGTSRPPNASATPTCEHSIDTAVTPSVRPLVLIATSGTFWPLSVPWNVISYVVALSCVTVTDPPTPAIDGSAFNRS